MSGRKATRDDADHQGQGNPESDYEPAGRGSEEGDGLFWQDRKIESNDERSSGSSKSAGNGSRERLYKIEQGGSLSSSANSSQVDVRAFEHSSSSRRSSRLACCGRFAVIHLIITAAFLVLLYGAYRASRSTHGQAGTGRYVAQILSNGTHAFAPTTIIVSLDGFRADFLHRDLTPNLQKFMREGASPQYMLPSFPSLTFPNHYTLVTGVYPEVHGIVGNSFWDPNTQKEFTYTNPAKSMVPEWWNAEPVWETAEKAGVRTAIHMWPGSEAHIGTIEPHFVDKFNGDEPLDQKVAKVLSWLDLPDVTDANKNNARPQLIATYVPNVDADGHLFGPNSTYIRSTIREVDGMLGELFDGLAARNLTEIVNVVIVSDHGMATTSNKRLMQFEDLVDPKEIEHTDGWPLYGLRPFNTSESKLHELHDGLVAKVKELGHDRDCDVYLREDIPGRYHFQHNDRIAPLWIVPHVGWAIVTREEFDVQAGRAKGTTYHPRGLHGYDNEDPLMRAIFLARGPAFARQHGSRLEPFQNIEVYNILCDTLGIEPVANNGTLRLPLQASGIHDFAKYKQELVDDIIDEEPDDTIVIHPDLGNVVSVLTNPASSTTSADSTTWNSAAKVTSSSDMSQETATSTAPSLSTTKPSSVIPSSTAPTRPQINDGQDPADARKDRTWWEWIKSQLDKAQNWAAEKFGGKNKDTSREADSA